MSDIIPFPERHGDGETQHIPREMFDAMRGLVADHGETQEGRLREVDHVLRLSHTGHGDPGPQALCARVVFATLWLQAWLITDAQERRLAVWS